MSTNGAIAIATPHQEGSFLAICRAAAERGQLARVYTTLYTAAWSSRMRYLPIRTLRRKLERQLARRQFPGVPHDRVESVALVSQLLHIGSMRVPKAHASAGRLLYFSKEHFDRAASTKLQRERFDAVVAMNFSAELTLKAARNAAGLAVLNFLDSHPRYQNGFLQEFCGLRHASHELVSPRFERRIERELDVADIVLVPSRFVARQLEEVGVPGEKVVVEPYGVDLSAFRADAALARSTPDGPLRCLYIGQISHRKGVCVLVEAARLLSGQAVEFHLFGPLVSPKVLANRPMNVHWHGPRLHAGVAETMRQGDVFLLPSIEDAFGLVTLEAMASALPVIVSEHVGASELITDAVDGLVVPPGDARALAAAVEELLESHEMRTRMGTKARERVERGCSWNDYGNRVVDLVLERGGQRAGTPRRSTSASGER